MAPGPIQLRYEDLPEAADDQHQQQQPDETEACPRLTSEVSFPAGTKVLLHSCCAPCSGSMIKILHDKGIAVTILWYNPNIHPRAEYELRKQENLRYAVKLGIPFVDLDYDSKEWFARAKGMEFDQERGGRCTMCFDMRMDRTALYAQENGFPWFTTTNATSRWKDQAQVNASGRQAAAKYEGVEFWEMDWQNDALTQLKYEINAEERFYKQEYCGCLYSLRDTNLYRKQAGQPPVTIGGTAVFSDPAVDAEEESLEAVEAFFKSSASNFDDERRAIYAARKKTAAVATQAPVAADPSGADGTAGAAGAAAPAACGLSSLNNW